MCNAKALGQGIIDYWEKTILFWKINIDSMIQLFLYQDLTSFIFNKFFYISFTLLSYVLGYNFTEIKQIREVVIMRLILYNENLICSDFIKCI